MLFVGLRPGTFTGVAPRLAFISGEGRVHALPHGTRHDEDDPPARGDDPADPSVGSTAMDGKHDAQRYGK